MAMAMTRAAPERISSLILLSTNPYASARPSETIGGRGATPSMLAEPRASCSWSGCRNY